MFLILKIKIHLVVITGLNGRLLILKFLQENMEEIFTTLE